MGVPVGPIRERVAGIDVHRMKHVVTILIGRENGTVSSETRELGGFKLTLFRPFDRVVRQLRPRRLVRQRHVVFAVELDEAAVGNEARERSAFFDRCNHVAFGVHDQYGTLDLPRGVSHVDIKTYLQQSDGGIRGGRCINESAWLNSSNSFVCCSAVMPIPVSARAGR